MSTISGLHLSRNKEKGLGRKRTKVQKRNTDRPLDMAVSDYLYGSDLLWKKLYSDREKSANWSWKEARPPRSQVQDGELPKRTS